MSEREPITAELRELMGGVEPRVDEDGALWVEDAISPRQALALGLVVE